MRGCASGADARRRGALRHTCTTASAAAGRELRPRLWTRVLNRYLLRRAPISSSIWRRGVSRRELFSRQTLSRFSSCVWLLPPRVLLSVLPPSVFWLSVLPPSV